MADVDQQALPPAAPPPASSPAAPPAARPALRRVTETQGDVEALWAALATGPDLKSFLQAWLALQCVALADPKAGVVVLREEGGFQPEAAWPADRPAQADLLRLAERAVQATRGVVAWARREPSRLELQVAFPLGTGAEAGAVAVALAVPGGIDSINPDAVLRQLRWGAGWVESRLWRRLGEDMAARADRTAVALDVVATASTQPRLKRACMAVANELTTRLRCDRVGVGLVRRGAIRLEALSRAADLQNRSQVTDAIENAMEECLLQRAPVAFPPAATTEARIAVAHAELAAIGVGTGAVMSVPLPGPAAPAGVLLLERHDGAAFTAGEILLAEAVAALLGPVIALQMQSDRLVAGRLPTLARDGLAALLGRDRPSLKLAALAVLAAAAFFCFASGTYRVTARSVLEGEVQRAAVAPFDGFIATAPARPGDRLRAGDVLATLDDRELRLERVRAWAEHEKLVQKYHEALAKHDRPATAMAEAQEQQAAAQLALAEDKLARTRITTPIDGIVVAGDLTQNLGSPVERGKVLFEMAPLDDYRVVAQVDDRDLHDVAPGQRASLVLASLPSETLKFTVARITPIAAAENGRNSFRVEGRLDDPPAGLRPGMEGVAKIDAGSHRLAWIWTHPLADWLRLTAFKWLP